MLEAAGTGGCLPLSVSFPAHILTFNTEARRADLQPIAQGETLG